MYLVLNYLLSYLIFNFIHRYFIFILDLIFIYFNCNEFGLEFFIELFFKNLSIDI